MYILVHSLLLPYLLELYMPHPQIVPQQVTILLLFLVIVKLILSSYNKISETF